MILTLFVGLSYGQEVIMNQPSADVPNQGGVFLRFDSFYTQHPAYFSGIFNTAVGLGFNAETSFNIADATHESRVFVPGFKWQVWKKNNLIAYVGDQIIVPNKGNAGNNSYEAVAWSTGNLRFTGGSFQSHNSVQMGNRAGAFAGVEWTTRTFRNGWTLMPGIDWASGAGSNGYYSPGLSFMHKSFFVCPGYMIGNPGNKFGAHQSFVMIGVTL
jgi:hypothetical protein